jgi:hypothetical protein
MMPEAALKAVWDMQEFVYDHLLLFFLSEAIIPFRNYFNNIVCFHSKGSLPNS